MTDPQMYKATKDAISRFHSVLGVRERNVKLADLDGNVMGISGEDGIFLNKRFYNTGYNGMVEIEKRDYEIGFSTQTHKPQAHTVTHELAHSTWTSHYNGANHKAAGKEISLLYQKWSSDTKKKGYGSYGRENIDEFWAELVTKAVHGKSDKYTKKAISIAKRYKL